MLGTNKFKDDSYQTDDGLGLDVIKGHDGSITIAYGDFRDDILLEFEKRIYNNIKVSFDPDAINIDNGFYRDNEYTSKEVNDLLARDFFSCWLRCFYLVRRSLKLTQRAQTNGASSNEPMWLKKMSRFIRCQNAYSVPLNTGNS